MNCALIWQVDDLDDIERLDEYIARTSFMVLFVSAGYFTSRSCQNEIKAVLKWHKPFMFVYEADQTKGGGPFEKLASDCPETLPGTKLPDEYCNSRGEPNILRWAAENHFESELRLKTVTLQVRKGLLLDEPEPRSVDVLRWDRVPAFQQLTLERIAANVIKVCDKTSVVECLGDVIIPGAVNSKPMHLKSPVHLFCSRSNPGSLEVGTQMIDELNEHNASFKMSRSRRAAIVQLDTPPSCIYRQTSPHDSIRMPASTLSRDSIRMPPTSTRRSSHVKQIGSLTVTEDEPRGVTEWLRHGTVSSPVNEVEDDDLAGHHPTATHMLLLLRDDTFIGDIGAQLANQVRGALMTKLPVVMLHDMDSCPFGRFFSTTPPDLIQAGLYDWIATTWLPDPHMRISLLLFVEKCVEKLSNAHEVHKREVITNKLSKLHHQAAHGSSLSLPRLPSPSRSLSRSHQASRAMMRAILSRASSDVTISAAQVTVDSLST